MAAAGPQGEDAGWMPGVPYGGNTALLNTARAKKNPGDAFKALSKAISKMPASQRNKLTSNLGNIFGVQGQGLGGQGKVQEALGNLGDMKLDYAGSQSDKEQGMNAIQQVLANAGLTGPGWQQAPAPLSSMGGVQYTPNINPPPGSPGLTDRDATGMPIGGGTAPQLNLGAVQGGAMGMAPMNTAPTLAQTVSSQATAPAATGTTGGLPAVPGTGGATGAGATAAGGAGAATGVQNSPTGGGATGAGATAPATAGNTGVPGATSANTSPLMASNTGGGATTNSLINTGALSSPGVGLDTVQNTVMNSPTLTNNPVTDQQMFQQTYNPMINMAGQADIQNQFSGTPGRSIVGGAFGEGGLMGTAQQQAINQATMQGGTAAQNAIKTNLQHQLQSQQAMAGMDATARQQAVQQANALLGPALSGAATGFQQGLGGLTRMPQFLG